jgi:predicted GNAT family N-acyltransferase
VSVLVHIEPLNSSHDRQAFDCGVQVLDRYLREQASQDVKRRVGNCFVAVDHETSAIAAYYTLAATSIPFTELPETETKRLPRYPVLPATLIGRLAVNRSHQGRHLGSALLMDALRRSMDAAPASFALVVDAKDDSAITFYRKCGFIALTSRPRSLFLPIATALKLFT